MTADSSGIAGKAVEYRPAETIFSQGDASDNVLYIQRGSVKLSVLSRGGNAYVRTALGMPLSDATGGFRAYLLSGGAGGTLINLGTLGGTRSFAYEVNETGHVVGYSDLAGCWPQHWSRSSC